VRKIGSATALVCAAAPGGALNDVMALGIDEPVTESVLDQVVAVYRSMGVRFLVRLSPWAQPSDLASRLKARGFALTGKDHKMYRSTDSPVTVPTELRVECVGREFGNEFGEVMQAGTGSPEFVSPWMAATVDLPGWRHYLAFDGATPVACGALCADGACGWLGMGATLPSHRRRGAQSAIMARRISDASEMGCRWVTTETDLDTPEHPNPSYHNMVRNGFEQLYVRSLYLSPTFTRE
jgi:hypothetical protein